MKIKINFKGVELDIDYDYREAEPQILYDGGGSGTQGCYAGIDTINEILHKGVDISLLVENDMNEIENLILEEL